MVINIEQEYCNKCHRWKPKTEFYVAERTRCKICCRRASREDRKKNKARRDETTKLWRINNPESYARVIKRQNLNRYGLTIEAHTAMLQVQFYKCAACGEKFEPGGMKRACVDHDHDTKQVRELLCNRCNLICIRSEDEIGRLEMIIAYLRRHGK